MEKITKYFVIGTLIIIAIVLGFSIVSDKNQNLGGVLKMPSYNSVTTSAVSATAGTSTVVLTQKGGRGYASICNDTTNAKGYIEFTTTATTSSEYRSIVLASGNCYEISQDNLYTGEIRYVPEATTTTLVVSEFIGY